MMRLVLLEDCRVILDTMDVTHLNLVFLQLLILLIPLILITVFFLRMAFLKMDLTSHIFLTQMGISGAFLCLITNQVLLNQIIRLLILMEDCILFQELLVRQM